MEEEIEKTGEENNQMLLIRSGRNENLTKRSSVASIVQAEPNQIENEFPGLSQPAEYAIGNGLQKTISHLGNKLANDIDGIKNTVN